MTNEIQTEMIRYKTKGTCSKEIQVQIFEDKIQHVFFLGGCSGNLQGINALIRGMMVDEVIAKMAGICCGTKDTSCPDQLAKALILYRTKRSEFKAKPSLGV